MLDKIKHRWGQWVAFGYGHLTLISGLMDHEMSGVVGGLALLLTGVGLRAIAIWREAQ